MTLVLQSPGEAASARGQPLGPSDWVVIDQQRIDAFARATGDDQWIHVDPVRAAQGPYGATIAHGYLTLSLVNLFLPSLLEVRNTSLGVNYGSDRVRFPAVVRVGSKVRAAGEVLAAEVMPDGAAQITSRVRIEIEHGERPACVADVISRFYPQTR